MNELIALSDDEREVLIQWNLDQMAHALNRDKALTYWRRAALLIRGRSPDQVSKMERARGLSRAA